MNQLPQELVELITFFANPRLSVELKQSIELIGGYKSTVYKRKYIRLKYTYKHENEFKTFRLEVKDASCIRELGGNRPMWCTRYYKGHTNNELKEILKIYYGGRKIPLVSKLKTKKQLVQRLMSL
mgnify:FL=1|tara:strand:+ start:217 stop:591 length:375 start_codon:yes stop_codon:yes gene_type:complete